MKSITLLKSLALVVLAPAMALAQSTTGTISLAKPTQMEGAPILVQASWASKAGTYPVILASLTPPPWAVGAKIGTSLPTSWGILGSNVYLPGLMGTCPLICSSPNASGVNYFTGAGCPNAGRNVVAAGTTFEGCLGVPAATGGNTVYYALFFPSPDGNFYYVGSTSLRCYKSTIQYSITTQDTLNPWSYIQYSYGNAAAYLTRADKPVTLTMTTPGTSLPSTTPGVEDGDVHTDLVIVGASDQAMTQVVASSYNGSGATFGYTNVAGFTGWPSAPAATVSSWNLNGRFLNYTPNGNPALSDPTPGLAASAGQLSVPSVAANPGLALGLGLGVHELPFGYGSISSNKFTSQGYSVPSGYTGITSPGNAGAVTLNSGYSSGFTPGTYSFSVPSNIVGLFDPGASPAYSTLALSPSTPQQGLPAYRRMFSIWPISRQISTGSFSGGLYSAFKDIPYLIPTVNAFGSGSNSYAPATVIVAPLAQWSMSGVMNSATNAAVSLSGGQGGSAVNAGSVTFNSPTVTYTAYPSARTILLLIAPNGNATKLLDNTAPQFNWNSSTGVMSVGTQFSNQPINLSSLLTQTGSYSLVLLTQSSIDTGTLAAAGAGSYTEASVTGYGWANVATVTFIYAAPSIQVTGTVITAK